MSVASTKTLLYDQLTSRFADVPSLRALIEAYRAGELPVSVRGPKGGLVGYVAARLVQSDSRPLLVVVPNDSEIAPLRGDLDLFGVPSVALPSWQTVAFGEPGLNSPAWGERVAALVALHRGQHTALVTSVRAITQKLPVPERALGKTFTVARGDTLDPVAVASTLIGMGYWRVPKATVPGEFSVRGEVIDVIVPGHETGTRLLLDFDEVSQIRAFDPGSQASTGGSAVAEFHPLREVVWTEDDLLELRATTASWPELRHAMGKGTDPFADPASDLPPYWISAFEDLATTVTSYLDSRARILWLDSQRLRASSHAFQTEHESQFASEHFRKPIPRPDRLFVSIETLIEENRGRSIHLESLADAADAQALRIACDAPRSFFGNITFLREELSSLRAAGARIAVVSDTDAQRKRIEHLLAEFEPIVLTGRLSAGFGLPAQRLIVIQENEIFGRRRRAPASLKSVQSAPIETFVDLDEGDYVVHVNHGIGRFQGIQRVSAAGNERDYVKLEYADGETVFAPIEQVNLIQRYIGSGGSPPRLDRIGGKSWEKRKSGVRQNVEDLADRLINLYAKRREVRGFAFPSDTEWQLEFESSFPYEETDDQLRAIAEVKQDMERPQPMDRLVCGDVGYGKTEVALRAAFKAVASGKQVAFLAPTTILAEQHYENMVDRFEKFPVRIEMLSRLVARSGQRQTLTALAAGDVDIVVGTHRILQRDVVYRDLGLLVIDEEQRFGVKAKERLKELKTNVDALTLTATPIPRTLHMSLLKIRDMSLITTPPHNRHPIKTVIAEFAEETVAGAIRAEIDRGGQVFFLHNRIETLENVRQFIERLVPETFVEHAHGQMGPTELEDVMHRFIHGAFQVLVATTIIENGIDIPNVNTIIIDRADMYGISQLYQLRGRVGRSDRVAYAYLFYPEERALSELAMKRLEIISDFTELGSGFKIALKDLEVRGAGNLLGSQQSGDILSVGFDLYLKMLEEAIRERREEGGEPDDEVLLELEYTGFIPDRYIEEPMEKMEVYKKIASVNSEAQLEGLVAEVEDRFGPMPDEVQSLLALAEIRMLGRRLRIASMRERKGVLEIEFGRVADVSVERVLGLIKSSSGTVRLDPRRPNVLVLETGSVGLKEKSEFIRGRLVQLL